MENLKDGDRTGGLEKVIIETMVAEDAADSFRKDVKILLMNY